MTTFQILSLCALGCAVLAVYAPSLKLKWPARTKSTGMAEIENIIAIRDGNTDPQVVAACNSLLAVLLKVKP